MLLVKPAIFVSGQRNYLLSEIFFKDIDRLTTPIAVGLLAKLEK